MEFRSLAPDEVAQFGVTPEAVNWGVVVGSQVIACFRAEPESYEPLVLNVHANVKRHTLTPQQTAVIARSFSEQLLARGAADLLCRIPRRNRAARVMARRAGYVPFDVDGEDDVLIYRRQTDGQQTESRPDAIFADQYLH